MNHPEEKPLSFYEALLAQHQPRLYAYILALVAHPADAKDVLQESNQVILSKLGELEKADRFTSWSYRIAYFQSLSLIKKRKRRWGLQSEVLLENIAKLSDSMSNQNEGKLRQLETCLEKLSEKTRSIVVEYYYRNQSIKDIGGSLGMNANHVAQILFRARKALYECMISVERNDDG